MAKRWFWLPLAALSTVLMVACVFAMFLNAAAPAPQNAAYTLRAQNGQIVLCRAQETAPIAYYEIYTALLPQSDVQDLQRGIAARNSAEVQRLLEDFGL
ncbi:MAG: hypothetical protein RSG59_06395 [Ruthenibacterium sp.]